MKTMIEFCDNESKKTTLMFFASVPKISDYSVECEIEIQAYLTALDAYSRMTDESIYVIDFYRRCFRFVSDHPLFLCRHTSSEVLRLGYNFYSLIADIDLPLIAGIHQVIYNYLHQSDTKFCEIDYIAFNFRIGNNKYRQMVCHKVSPLIVNGRPQLAICRVSESVRKEPGNLTAYYQQPLASEYYIFAKRKWEPLADIHLTPQEKEVLRLAKQGKAIKETALLLHMNEQSIRNLRYYAFRKLDVCSIEQAMIAIKNRRIFLE